ncbi:MAG: amino acid transporter [Flavobacteriales bacterium]|jgi:amino acid transporter
MDKDLLVKGIKYMALAFPFIFATPIVLTAAFTKVDKGEYLLLIIALMLMAITFFLAIKGLRTILKAIFDNNAQ